MLPRVRADYRALLWVFVLMPLFAVAQYVRPGLAGWLLPFSMYLAYSAGVLAHNHNHAPVFSNRRANAIYSSALSFFYGYPTFAWIPTHNENHHRFLNGPEDATSTERHTSRNTPWAAFTFFFASSAWQAPLIKRYLRRAKARSKKAYAWLLGQYVIVFGGHLAALALAIHLHGPKLGAFVYFSALGFPAGAALWGLMFTNYVQHIDCETGSEWNHSRNFVSPWMNFFVFDNGFHTIHHMKAGLHWSRSREAHRAIEANIDPRLNESSIFGYCAKVYLFGMREDLRELRS